MNKITRTEDIFIGEEYLFEESSASGAQYFESYPVRVKIESFDGKDFWIDTKPEDSLSEKWEGYESLCIGSPDDNDVSFYEIDQK